MLPSMALRCRFLDFFIIFILISISFAIDGSLPKGPYEKTVYLKAKGQSRSVNLHDIQTKKRWPTTAKGGRLFTPPDPPLEKNEDNDLSMFADYELVDLGKVDKVNDDPIQVVKRTFTELSTKPISEKTPTSTHSKGQLYSKEPTTNKHNTIRYTKDKLSIFTRESVETNTAKESKHILSTTLNTNHDNVKEKNDPPTRAYTKQDSPKSSTKSYPTTEYPKEQPENIHTTESPFKDQSEGVHEQYRNTNPLQQYPKDETIPTHSPQKYSTNHREKIVQTTTEFPGTQTDIQNDTKAQIQTIQTTKEYPKEQTQYSTIDKNPFHEASTNSISPANPSSTPNDPQSSYSRRNTEDNTFPTRPELQDPNSLPSTAANSESPVTVNKGGYPYNSVSPTNLRSTSVKISESLSTTTKESSTSPQVIKTEENTEEHTEEHTEEQSASDIMSPSPPNTDNIKSVSKESTILPISSESETFTSHPLEYLTITPRQPSQQRIEITEGEQVDIIWLCPPTQEQSSIHPSLYEWYKMSKTGTHGTPLPSTTDVATNKSVLEIKGANATHENRYFCIARKTDPFTSTQIYFYQIIILYSKWINIGSVDVVDFYSNQKLILNCPYGDIIKNNASQRGSCCSSRVTIKESRENTNNDTYRCSNSDKITIKMPVKDSSENCSLSLLGCTETKRKSETSQRKLSEKIIIESLSKCNFNNDKKPLINHSIQTRCFGKTFLRFYFDDAQKRCFPFETGFCGEDNFSFESLRKCEEACVTIIPDLHPCFNPLNGDIAETCSTLELKGTYMVTYNMEKNQCQWFYHCGDFPLTKNVFKSISKCNKVCVHNERVIKLESFKACDSPIAKNDSSSSTILDRRWSFNKERQKCELIIGPLSTNPSYLSFTTKKKCETICRKIDEEICQSRPENGICSSQSLKWYFNIRTRRCIPILDGNCGKSLNRFDSRTSCEKICNRLLDRTTTIRKSNTTASTEHPIPNVSATVETLRPISHIKITPNVVSIRKRFHRGISNHSFPSSMAPSTSAPERSTSLKYFTPVDSEIDFDPCFKDPIKGSCDYGFGRQTYEMIRHSFKPQTGRCYKIKFTGCKGGENLFDDASDCKSACEFRLHRSLKSPKCQNPYSEKCIAPDDTKTQERLERYFYLPLTGECVPFTSVNTTHCANQYFTSVDQCRQVCIPKPPMEHMLQNRCFGKIVLSDHSCSADEKIYLWFFLTIINQCLQYATCPVEVDGNAFYTKVDCEHACKTSNIHAVCDLSMDTGRGLARKRRYFYDSQMGKCRLFYYQGSLGNLNRFKTKKECEGACLDTLGNADSLKHSSLVSSPNDQRNYKGTSTEETWLNAISDREYCYDSHRYGGCSPNNAQVFVKKYYYDAYRKQCEPYMFSGCGSISKNSFESVNICDKMCTERIARTTSSLCSQKVSRCSESQWVYWTYNPERGACEPFSSCIKKSEDQFFFTGEQHCSQLCAPPLPLKKDHFDVCHLPPSINKNCSRFVDVWHFDDPTRTCFSAMGCPQYGNNFPSKASCLAACEPVQLKDVCQLPVDKGPCNDNETLKYYFDWSSQTCRSFSYGGCLGNRNRFRTVTECEQMCRWKNGCDFRFNNTKCTNPTKHSVSHLYFYDIRSGQCVPVSGFVCGDHTKFFPSKDACNKLCRVPEEFQSIVYKAKPNITSTKHARCLDSLKFDQHPICTHSEEWLPRFFYDHHNDQCTFFYYNGCNGTQDFGNRFTRLSQCEDTCRTTKSTVRPNPISSLSRLTTSKHLLAKSGFCPERNSLCSDGQEKSVKCEFDNDCPGSWKCCSCEKNKSTMSLCIDPLSCMATKYGCCADGVTLAMDNIHTNCISQAPRIDSSLEEVIRIEPDEDLILNCQVTGDPKPNITWVYFGNSTQSFIVESKWDLIHPIWSGVVKIPAAQYSQGLWSCQTVNSAGWDEKEVFVHSSIFKMGFLKTYSFGKEDGSVINVTLDTKVVFHCPIYGLPRPTFTWFYDRISVNDSFQSISVFGRHLQINSVKFMHDGIWTCNAANRMGYVSYSIKLRIHNPLKIFPPPMGTRIKANYGQKVLLFCDVRIEGKRWINWFLELDGKSFKLNSTLKTDPRILLISSFRSKQAATYVCEAHNDVSEDRIKFTIVPYNEDDILVHPAGALFAGMTITLVCPTKSSEKIVNVQWKKQDNLLDRSSPELTIMLKSKYDSGFYSCQHSGRNYLTYLFISDKLMDL